MAQRLTNAQVPRYSAPLDDAEWHACRALSGIEWHNAHVPTQLHGARGLLNIHRWQGSLVLAQGLEHSLASHPHIAIGGIEVSGIPRVRNVAVKACPREQLAHLTLWVPP